MPVYILVGPAAALIGIVAILFVMRNRSTQNKSMYSSRRGQIERKVQAARARTLAPRGRSQKPPTPTEIAAAAPAAPSVYQSPAAPARQAWEAPAAPPPAYAPPPEYTPPPAPEYAAPAPPASPFAEPSTPMPTPAQPEWSTPTPSEPSWTPAPAPAPDYSAPAEPARSEPATPVSTPAGEGASWEIIGGQAPAEAPAEDAPKGKKGRDKDKGQRQATGAAWQLSSGDAPGAVGDDGDEEQVKKPSAAMALAQYAVLVVGLVMVLIGVLVMVANSKVT